MMLRSALGALAASLTLTAALAPPAIAQTLDDRHLPVVPRTAKEQARIKAVTAPATDFATPEKYEAKPGGAATVRARDTADAFSLSSANMPFAREMDFKLGNGLFRKTWVAAPSAPPTLRAASAPGDRQGVDGASPLR